MATRVFSPLLAGALWALPAAVLATISPISAALFAVLGLLMAVLRLLPCPRAGLLALPTYLAALAPPAPPPPQLPAGPLWVAGTVHGLVRAPVTGAVTLRVGRAQALLRLDLDADLDALPGDRIRLLAHATPPAAPGLLPGLQAVAATAAVTPGTWSLARAAAAARRALERALLAHLPAEPAALLAALVLGRDTRPAGDVVAAHRATGLSHLLAVSGAHAAMLAFLLGLCTWHGRRRVGGRRGRTWTVLALLIAYAAITGNEPPVLRAVAAYALAAFAGLLGRPCGTAPVLLAPAILTAFVQPTALLGPSFLLSYAAVAGLVLAGAPRSDSAWARWVVAPLRASAWAALLTAPLTLYFFGQLAPWTVLLTPLLAPLVAALLLSGLAVALLGVAAPPLADLLALPTGWCAQFYGWLVQAADVLPLTPLQAPFAPPAWALVLAGIAAAAGIAWRRDRLACAASAVALSLPHFLPLHPQPEPRFVLFAVGHGQACLVTTATGWQGAIDCGSLQAPAVAAERLAGALPSKHLDLLVVTHADSDHHAGVPGLLSRVRVAAAVLPCSLAGSRLEQRLRAHGAAVHLLAPGASFAAGAWFTVHSPPVPAGSSDNDSSLWTSTTLGNVRILTSGDAQELGIAAALAGGLATPHDVLVLPHHGRANANAAHLLAAVAPRACLASAASADGETLLGPLVRARGRELWITGVHGTLTVRSDPGRVTGEVVGRPLPPADPAPRH